MNNQNKILVIYTLYLVIHVIIGIKINSNSYANKPIKNIAIIGGGTGGLSLSSALLQFDNDIKISLFEKRDNILTPSLGGGLQLSGGAAVLNKLNCLNEIDNIAENLNGIKSRNYKYDELLQKL